MRALLTLTDRSRGSSSAVPASWRALGRGVWPRAERRTTATGIRGGMSGTRGRRGAPDGPRARGFEPPGPTTRPRRQAWGTFGGPDGQPPGYSSPAGPEVHSQGRLDCPSRGGHRVRGGANHRDPDHPGHDRPDGCCSWPISKYVLIGVWL